MTTLTESPLAPLLDRLFQEADALADESASAFADLSAADRASLMHSKTGYRDFYGRLKNAPLPVSRETGALLYMLARSSGAKTIIEFGTSFGISTLHLAAALRDNGGGRLITSEFEPSKAARARANLSAGGLLDLVEIREGDALQTLSVDLPKAIDLVLLDGAKGALSGYLGPAGKAFAARRVDRRRQRRSQPRLPGARALAREGLSVRAVCRGCGIVDADGVKPLIPPPALGRADWVSPRIPAEAGIFRAYG
jgi:predicted O-methyltransferase YrrM